MNFIFTKFQKMNRLSMVFLLVGFILCGLIWPIGIVKEKRDVTPQSEVFYESGYVKDDIFFQQNFVPQYNRIDGIEIMISNEQAQKSGVLYYSIFDNEGQQVYSTSIEVKSIPNRQYYNIPTKLSVVPEKQYYYTVSVRECMGEGIRVLFGDKINVGIEEQTQLIYANEKFEQYSSLSKYHYYAPVEFMKRVSYYAWIVTIMSLCYTLMILFRNKGK